MKTILITGASSGIGKDAALQLFDQGYTVYGAARRVDRLETLVGHGLRPLEMDVTKEDDLRNSISTIIDETGRIDGLVNNAGYGEYGSLEDTPMDLARYQFEVNVFGLARLTQLSLPHMRKQKSGRIINVSSIGGQMGEPHGAWYHATKFAVEGLSDSLRMEVAQFGIEVVVIQPGAIQTEWNTIARERLLKTSGDTAYGPLVHKHAAMLANADARGSSPAVVGRAIVAALTDKRPKTRYVVGAGAKPILWARHWLSDRMFDRLMLRAID
ncbi:MAG: oxidoreductase [Rhodothermales bacterium]